MPERVRQTYRRYLRRLAGTCAFVFFGTMMMGGDSQETRPDRDAAPPNQPEQESAVDPWRKIEIDLGGIDGEGLRGPDDGKVSVSYEFAIPNTERHRTEVQAIDSTVQFMPGSKGRIGAKENECLCIGSTHQADFRAVLRRLCELPYVKRIIECHFE